MLNIDVFSALFEMRKNSRDLEDFCQATLNFNSMQRITTVFTEWNLSPFMQVYKEIF